MSRTRILPAALAAAALVLSAPAAGASNEPGLPGVTIYLDVNDNGQAAQARRELNGALAKFQSERPPSPYPEVIIHFTSTVSLAALQRAVKKFEAALGQNRPQVRACRSRETRCMRRCRAKLRRERIKGRCSCIAVRARCLKRIRFSLDRQAGETRFGDGQHGRRPPK